MGRFLTGLVIALLTAAAAGAGERLSLTLELGAAVPFRIEASPDEQTLIIALKDKRGLPAAAWPLLRPQAEVPEVSSVSRRSSDGEWLLVLHTVGGFGLVQTALHGRRLDILAERVSPPAADTSTPEASGTLLPLVMIDPGHGGIDSGAVRKGQKEADIALSFARELSDALVRSGRFRVRLTRNEDVFMRLSQRVARARESGAHAFLSLHADALETGRANGAAVYTLSQTASDEAAAELVETHARADQLPGGDPGGTEDDIAAVLVDLARSDTVPRSEALAASLVAALGERPGGIRKRARQSGDFGVLKAPDIPSVLVELGFMSDDGDLARLSDPEWRREAAGTLRDGLINWLEADTLAAGRRRK